MSIGIKQVKGMVKQEHAYGEDGVPTTNIVRQVQRLSQKTKEENEIKKEKHIMKKRFLDSKVAPGAHQDIVKMSDFKFATRPEYLQFFGSTDCKIADTNLTSNKNPNVGPGTYEINAKKQEKRAHTANFASHRKDMLFSGNSNPGPQ